MSNSRGRNEEEDDLEADDNNKRQRNNQDLELLTLFLANKVKEKEKEEDTDDDNKDMIDDCGEDTDDDDDDYEEQLEDGPFYSECLPPPDDESDIDDQDDDDCGYISDFSDDHPLKQDEKVHVDPHSGFTRDLVVELPVKEDGNQEEHDALERRIEARRSPKMCSGQKEVDIDEEEEEKGENRDSGGDNKVNWDLADILVTVHKPGEDSSIGVVRHVLPDGSFEIALGSSGNGEVIIAVRSEIEIVAPRVSDKVKIMGGAQHGATGKLIDTEEGDAIVKVDGDTLNKDLVLDMNILAKLACVC